MIRRWFAITALLASAASAHRLDEYLQSTMITLSPDRLQAELRLTPGVAVLPVVLADIDPDADGAISPAEQRAYVARVLADLSLRLNGEKLTPHLLSMSFPTMPEIKDGLGEIRLAIQADLPRLGRDRKLIIENRHRPSIAAFQVNCLVPADPKVRVVAQTRNWTQSVYELSYQQDGGGTSPLTFAWIGIAGLLVVVRVAMRRRPVQVSTID